MFVSPVQAWKSLNNISFGVAPNYQFARGTHMSWASPEKHEWIKLVSYETEEMELGNCVVMETYLTF
jgi:hypothetical protein